jgi:hypothetical protein
VTTGETPPHRIVLLAETAGRGLEIVHAGGEERAEAGEDAAAFPQIAQHPLAAEELDPGLLSPAFATADMQDAHRPGAPGMGAAAGGIVEVGHRDDAHRTGDGGRLSGAACAPAPRR